MIFVNDEANGSAFDTIEKKIEEAEKMNAASFLKDRRKFRVKLRMVGHDGAEVIDKSGRSRLPSVLTLDKLLLDEGKSMVLAVAGFKTTEERESLVTLSYDGLTDESYYQRRDLDPSKAMPAFVVADSCELSYRAFRLVYEQALVFGVVRIPIFAAEVA